MAFFGLNNKPPDIREPLLEGGDKDEGGSALVDDLFKKKQSFIDKADVAHLDEELKKLNCQLSLYFVENIIKKLHEIPFHKHITFEPRNITQKVHAVFQNSIEMLTFLLQVAFALKWPNLISCGTLVLVFFFNAITWMNIESRYKYRTLSLEFMIFLMVALIPSKIYYFNNYVPKEALNAELKIKWLEALGFVVMSKDEASIELGKIEINTMKSFSFEISSILVFFVALAITSKYRSEYFALKK